MVEIEMGDRTLVIFTDGNEVSPTVYLHWMGDQVPKRLEEHKELMKTRTGDVPYAAARFIGICHTYSDGNMSIGCWNTPEAISSLIPGTLADGSEPERVPELKSYSHGDAGVVVVDVRDYSWKAFGGYLSRKAASSTGPSP